jgi:hypothetical protein
VADNWIVGPYLPFHSKHDLGKGPVQVVSGKVLSVTIGMLKDDRDSAHPLFNNPVLFQYIKIIKHVRVTECIHIQQNWGQEDDQMETIPYAPWFSGNA